MEKQFIGNCVDNPFESLEKLSDIIDNAYQISKRTFLKHCHIEDHLRDNMKLFPFDYDFYKNGNIYFFTHSAIEYFYI